MNIFNSCPNCKSEDIDFLNKKKILCGNCNFEYYHNVAIGIGAIIKYKDKIILTRRANNPKKGMLDLPGGFAEPGESAEQALFREVNEEIGLELRRLDYFNSFSNTYEYKGITYNTCDIFFTTSIDEPSFKKDNEEINEIIMIHPNDIKLTEIGFNSIKSVIKEYLKTLKK